MVYQEHSAFVSLDRRQIYTVNYVPRNPPRAHCLFLNSFDNEANNSIRLYVRASRELASAGFSVTRFDYYGTGNSSGVLSDVTISTLERDIAGIVDMTRVDSLPLWLVAGRFGASLGLLAAGAGLEVDGLILWDPILNLSQEFRTRFVNKTLLTNKLMSDGPTSRVALDQIADTSGIVELSCLAFRSQFYRELSVFALGVCSGRRIPHALVLFTGSSAPAREIEILTSFVRGDGLMIRALNAANAARNWAAEGFSESQAATFLLQNTTEFVAGRNPALRTELWKNSFEFQT